MLRMILKVVSFWSTNNSWDNGVTKTENGNVECGMGNDVFGVH